MELVVFKRRFSGDGNYVFCANNLAWVGQNENKLKEPNSAWWVQVDEKETISELVSSIKEGVEKIFPQGKHLEFIFENKEGKMIQVPFDKYILATFEDLSKNEFEEFLKICADVFKDWEG